MTHGEARYRPADIAHLLGLPTPTAEQSAVIEAPLGPAVVIAGAGSGKTETMAARVVWLVANGMVAPERILGLTFTRKAAGELQQRIRRRLRTLYSVLAREGATSALPPDAAGEPTVLTYAAYAGRLVDEHGIVLGLEPGSRLLTEAARWQVADSVVRSYSGSFNSLPGVIATVTDRTLGLAGQLADHLVEPQQIRALSRRLRDELDQLPLARRARSKDFPTNVAKLLDSLIKRDDLLPLVEAFAERKRTDALVDFADQMVLAARLARRDSVVRTERSRFDVVLLDEYQDTGFAQIDMLAGLFADGRAVTAVGDPLQSIYSWRGASAGSIARFADRFRTGDGEPATVFPLMTSWRNDRQILAVSNQIAEPLRAPGELPLAERPDAGPGRVLATYAETIRDEANWLADQLRAEWDGRTDWSKGERTLAVLVRKRSAIGLIAQSIRQCGLPVEVVDIGGLLTLPEVADVRAVLTVLTDHNAGGSLARLLTGARWRIGAADLVALHEHARVVARRTSASIEAHLGETELADGDAELTDAERIEPSLIEALDDLAGAEAATAARFSAEGYRRLTECAAILRRLRRRLDLPLPDLMAEIEIALGLDVEVAARPGTSYSALAGRANLDRFADEAARFMSDRAGASITAFLGYLNAAEDEEYGLKPATVEVTPERVQVLTVHGAKGLEWDVVAVAGLVADGFPDQPKSHDWTRTPALLPSPLRGDADQLPRLDFAGCEDRGEAEKRVNHHHDELKRRHVNEERRLAYVAFTRARKSLLLSGACWGTGSRPREPSMFLTELRENPAVTVLDWYEREADAGNPLELDSGGHSWPFDPLGDRRPQVEKAAERVLAVLTNPVSEACTGSHSFASNDGAALEEQAAHEQQAAQWARDVELLLAERDARERSELIEVPLPAQLSVSEVVALSADAQALARRLRRPLPQQPAKQARRGTAFHQWLEQRWSASSLLDIDDLPGAMDELSDAGELAALKSAFEASPWAARTPVGVEVGFEMSLGGRVIRGRMDAVFDDGGGSYTVVDWKTGRPPSGTAAQTQGIQLALYRLAWAALQGIPDDELHRVRAAFHYVEAGLTVYAPDLLDADQLRDLVNADNQVASGLPAPDSLAP